MFTLYQSNKLSSLAEMLVKLQQVEPLDDPFEPETVLVQSLGMAQWLQMQIAELSGVAGNFSFPYPTTFIWQQYRLLFPELPKENVFEQHSMTWRIMRLLPDYLEQSEFSALKSYLGEKTNAQYQLKLFQLSEKIADLFDRYLVYRPHWLVFWEEDNLQAVEKEISSAKFNKNKELVFTDMLWQSRLWKHLIHDLKSAVGETVFMTSHRAYLQQNYFNKLDGLTEQEKSKLPKRIFVFGISSFPPQQLAVLKKLSDFLDIHVFFLNPSEKYWGDSVKDEVWEKLALNKKISSHELDSLLSEQNNKLLTIWGKQGRDFLAQLMEFEPNTIDVFIEPEEDSNLNKIKKQLFISENNRTISDFNTDCSIQVHSCHSPMREVEVLHNQLLNLFEQDKSLLPKDIIVMSPDINKYAPYIEAVFSRYAPNYISDKGKKDPRYIPFSLSDQLFAQINPIIASFSQLLAMKESEFNAEALLDLLDVKAIQERFSLNEEAVQILRLWVKNSGIRSGDKINQSYWQNYNSWENGLNRLLLGSSLKDENGIWEETLAFSDSYGINAELVGLLTAFIMHLLDWVQFIQQPHSLLTWHNRIKVLIKDFYQENEENTPSLLLLDDTNTQLYELILATNFDGKINIDIIELLFKQNLNSVQNNLSFLVGRVNFATLLPMRAIPFKVVCLLGMNEADFPRQQAINSFDLMQYAMQKGDPAKRDDDRYLFLETLLSAQDVFYISYIGQSQKDGKEMLPSVLVSQLLDAINDYAEEESGENPAEKLVRKQPLTIFSKKNFEHKIDFAYNTEWTADFHQGESQDFLDRKIKIEKDNFDQIDIADLISFLQNPVKYFFLKILGVSFNTYNDSIDESEIFLMSGLDNYSILDELLLVKQEEQELFFKKEHLRGNLPASNFAKITEQNLVTRIESMRNSLSSYLSKESTVLSINQSIELEHQAVLLTGNIANMYENNIVLWRVGNLRDKDRIQAWVYHLYLSLYQPEKKVSFYYRNGDETEVLNFAQVSKEEALQQLTIYLDSYIAGLSQAQLVIYNNIDDYFNKEQADGCREAIYDLAEDNQQDARYLNRILAQSRQLDYGQIQQRTQDWFKLMMSKITT